MQDFGALFGGLNPFTVILAGWPVAFLWLLRYTIIQGYKREKELIEVNRGWQLSFDRLSAAIDKMTNAFLLGYSGRGGNDDGKGATGGSGGSEGNPWKGSWGGLG
jgi:hypothetical protein